MLSRRAFVGKLAAGAAAVGVVSSLGQRAEAARTGPEVANAAPGTPAEPLAEQLVDEGVAGAAPSPPPWELVAPLVAGALVHGDWRLSALDGVSAGSCVATLSNGRRTQRVHLCRNGGRPSGVVHTERVDLVVMNGGDGALATDEGLAQAVAALAHVVARNEARVADLDELLGHEERVALYADSARLR